MNGSLWSLPLRTTCPSRTAIRSPPTPTTRLMKVCLDCCGVGAGHGWSSACWAPQRGGVSSAPAGGWKVMMSPTLGSAPRRWLRRLTSTRWPTSSVGSIDPLGIR